MSPNLAAVSPNLAAVSPNLAAVNPNLAETKQPESENLCRNQTPSLIRFPFTNRQPYRSHRLISTKGSEGRVAYYYYDYYSTYYGCDGDYYYNDDYYYNHYN